jgi:hypothetical protein
MDNIIRNDPVTYYENALIKAPYAKKMKHVRLVVDSRERNMTLFPNPNAYEINILEDIENVVSMSLLHADFPFDSYLVSKNNCVLILAYNSIVYTIEIDVGNYTVQELATELTNALNIATSTADFLVEYDSKKDNFKFRCMTPFGLVFRGRTVKGQAYNNSEDTLYPDRSIGRLLGFGINNYASVLDTNLVGQQNVIRSEFKKNFNVQDYVVVSIDTVELNKSTADSLNNSFAIITKKNTTYEYDTNYVVKVFNPPLKRLHKLKFSFVDYYGNLIDFQNMDHRFEIQILCEQT